MKCKINYRCFSLPQHPVHHQVRSGGLRNFPEQDGSSIVEAEYRSTRIYFICLCLKNHIISISFTYFYSQKLNFPEEIVLFAFFTLAWIIEYLSSVKIQKIWLSSRKNHAAYSQEGKYASKRKSPQSEFHVKIVFKAKDMLVGCMHFSAFPYRAVSPVRICTVICYS